MMLVEYVRARVINVHHRKTTHHSVTGEEGVFRVGNLEIQDTYL